MALRSAPSSDLASLDANDGRRYQAEVRVAEDDDDMRQIVVRALRDTPFDMRALRTLVRPLVHT